MTVKELPASVNWPADRRNVPLWALFDRVKDVGHPDEEMLSVYRAHGVVKKSSRDDNSNRTAENRNIYQLIDDGWLIVNRMKAWQGSVGISALRGIVSGHYLCFRPRHDEDSRFLNWLLRSNIYTIEYARMSRGVRPGQIEIDNDELRELRIALPPLDEQRRIADFLDTETSRITRAIALIIQQKQALDERYQAVIDIEISGAKKLVPLKYLASIIDTEHKTAPSVAGGGYWIVGTGAVRRGRINQAALYETDLASFQEWTRRRKPRPGDVLLSREAPVGEVGLYKLKDPQLAIGQRMVLISSYRECISSEYLVWTLLSSRTRRFVDDVTQGSLHPHLNMSDIGSILIGNLSLPEQESVVLRISSTINELEALIELRNAQLALLAERRQALITAAVTGKIDVTTARGLSSSGDVAV
jgi:type I restriction enzyme S subunit